MIQTVPPSTLDELRALLDRAHNSKLDDYRDAGHEFEEEAAEFMDALLDASHPSHRRVLLELREFVTR